MFSPRPLFLLPDRSFSFFFLLSSSFFSYPPDLFVIEYSVYVRNNLIYQLGIPAKSIIKSSEKIKKIKQRTTENRAENRIIF